MLESIRHKKSEFFSRKWISFVKAKKLISAKNKNLYNLRKQSDKKQPVAGFTNVSNG